MGVNWQILTIPVTWMLVSVVLAYPEGPPESACIDMQPGVTTGVVGPIGHLASSQNVLPTYGNSKKSPYYMIVYSTQYTPNQQIQVSILANQTTGMSIFKGVFLQARKVICSSDIGLNNETILVEDAPVGEFLALNRDAPLMTKTCGGLENSAICHRTPQFKINETVTWVAPATPVGHIVFRATIVQEAWIYWTHVHSLIIQDPSAVETATRTCGCAQIYGYYGFILTILLCTKLFF